VGPRADLDDTKKYKFLHAPVFEHQPVASRSTDCVIPACRVLLQNLIVLQTTKKIPGFYDDRSSLPFS
jgi:hypothetical protein